MININDKEVQRLIENEYKRQQDELEMIASENYVSKDVMNAYSNVYTNKYSEGYPGKRYYGGQINVDELELLCQKRALEIFKLDEKWGVNVQPLSGSPANLAVYMGVLKPGDTILGMSLDTGGHLSHGHPLNASGIYYNIVAYGVKKEDYLIDYDEILEKALKEKPKLILAGFSAYPRNIDWERFDHVANEVEKLHNYRPILMADIAHIAGLIAGEAIKGPFEYFDIVTTTTHKTLRGPRGGLIYFRKGTFSRNNESIDFEKTINRGVFPGLQGGPHEHIIAAKTVAFGEILNGDFKNYAKNVIKNAQTLANELIKLGWPIISNGTDNHIVLLDVSHKYDSNGEWIEAVSGKTAEKILEEVGISVNKNKLPFDPKSALDPSGIRLGTPAITTRGLGENEMIELANIIDQSITHHNQKDILEKLKQQVNNICKRFPLEY